MRPFIQTLVLVMFATQIFVIFGCSSDDMSKACSCIDPAMLTLTYSGSGFVGSSGQGYSIETGSGEGRGGWMSADRGSCVTKWFTSEGGAFPVSILHSGSSLLPTTIDLTTPVMDSCPPSTIPSVIDLKGVGDEDGQWELISGELQTTSVLDGGYVNVTVNSKDLVLKTKKGVNKNLTFSVTGKYRRFCAKMTSSGSPESWVAGTPTLDASGVEGCIWDNDAKPVQKSITPSHPPITCCN